MTDYRFEISFSFAGSNRKLIEQVATHIQRRLGEGKVYFDDWFKHELHGPDMDHELTRIYCNDSRMVVACLSKNYSDRPWCTHELKVIRDWGDQLNTANDRTARLRLSYLRFDSTPFLELRDTDDAYFVSDKDPSDIADYLLKRHAKLLAETPRRKIAPSAPSLLALATSWLKRGPKTARPALRPVVTTLPSWKCRALDATLVTIPVGTFLMGTPDDRTGNERQHHVTIKKPFHLGVSPVTRAQWTRIMGECPKDAKPCPDDHPVVHVSWEDCEQFLERLSRIENRRFRLPTEAEWEYACRARSNVNSTYLWGDKLAQGEGWANLYDQSGHREHRYNQPCVPWDDTFAKTSPVQHFYPNSIGLYDMIGNVWEWCSDWFGPYPAGPLSDPTGPATGAERVLRGSSWFDPPEKSRIACRHKAPPLRHDVHIGFRIAAD